MEWVKFKAIWVFWVKLKHFEKGMSYTKSTASTLIYEEQQKFYSKFERKDLIIKNKGKLKTWGVGFQTPANPGSILSLVEEMNY